MNILDALFSGFRVYRRLRGGHWERWWIGEPVCASTWLRIEHGSRPGLGCVREDCHDARA